jgi:hypothetical protein
MGAIPTLPMSKSFPCFQLGARLVVVFSHSTLGLQRQDLRDVTPSTSTWHTCTRTDINVNTNELLINIGHTAIPQTFD